MQQYKIPLKDTYEILIEGKIVSLITEKYLMDLEYEFQAQFSTSEKSKFIFICEYFNKIDFNRENFRMMLHLLRQGKIGKRMIPLNVMTLNKYILTGGYIDTHLKLNYLIKYPLFKREQAAKPKGDLITDSEMKRIAECYIKRGLRLNTYDRTSNLMFKTAIQLMRFTGMPPDDLVNLRWGHDMGTHFDIFRNKTRLDRQVPILPLIRSLIDQMPHYDHGYIFAFKRQQMRENTLCGEIQRRAAKLGIKKWVTNYSFRYSMITWCYVNAEEGTLSKLSKITGHTLATAHKHYLKYNIKHLSDALYATHPGLIKHQTIDVIKRLCISFLSKFIDISKYQIHLEITPKEDDKRVIHLS